MTRYTAGVLCCNLFSNENEEFVFLLGFLTSFHWKGHSHPPSQVGRSPWTLQRSQYSTKYKPDTSCVSWSCIIKGNYIYQENCCIQSSPGFRFRSFDSFLRDKICCLPLTLFLNFQIRKIILRCFFLNFSEFTKIQLCHPLTRQNNEKC